MPEPAGDTVSAGNELSSSSAPNGAARAELAQLRQLIIGPELDELSAIRDRFDDTARRGVDVAAVLPDAIRNAKPKVLREALEPIFERVFQSSVRKHPQEIADAIYPVIGPAIRQSISSAIRDFAETLNQIVEKSASLRAIRWRIEARITGKPFSEILLARSLLYSVEQVFLVHRKSGLLLQHVAAQNSVLKDADMISGMLSAIHDFVTDSFAEGGQDLEMVDAGRFKLWIQYGPTALLAAAVSGNAPVELKGVLRNTIDQIHQTLSAELGNFKQDDLSVFDPAHPLLAACLLGQAAPKKRKPWIPALVGLLLLIGLGLYAFFAIRSHLRWNHFFEALKARPGIVVTRIEKESPGYVISGLKDPEADDPTHLLQANQLNPAKVHFDWQPYLMLTGPFAAQREIRSARAMIEKQIIRFESGDSRLPLAEFNRIDELVPSLQKWFAAHQDSVATVVGRTDEAGSLATNAKLADNRAQHVIAALVSQGVPSARLKAVAMGNQQPLRTGGTEWDRAANRSVSFQLTP
jgi:outer membrane protein OmpA-like peptidoglycan-associated protein